MSDSCHQCYHESYTNVTHDLSLKIVNILFFVISVTAEVNILSLSISLKLPNNGALKTLLNSIGDCIIFINYYFNNNNILLILEVLILLLFARWLKIQERYLF